MVLGVAVAGGFGIGSWLWGYNRENFKFDREMRQKNEFKILEFRNVQSQLWREDIRDIIALTEKKMDNYLIVSVLQLDACVSLFTEGRLEPGTPPWLLHLYMMTLGAAFMYLLMSVWFAMHASVVAQCSSVRLLTQFVRLPIPTWQDIEQMRTYASSYEKMHPAHWLRVPFTSSFAPGSGLAPPPRTTSMAAPTKGGAGGADPVASAKSADSMYTEGTVGAQPPEPSKAYSAHHADPWGLEAHGQHRRIYELSEEHPALRRHVLLARKAAAQYQCYDAFARVSMTFGTNQFLSAIAYYSMGYVAVQDGAPWVAVGVATTMACMAMAMIAIDFSLTRCEQFTLQAPIVVALATAVVCTFTATMKESEADADFLFKIFPYLLPVTYIANGFWLFRALRSCGILEQDNGSWLPTKFRAILYLDVFGWLVKKKKSKMQGTGQASTEAIPSASKPSAAGLGSPPPSDPAASSATGATQLPGSAVGKPALAGGFDGFQRTGSQGPSGQIVDVPEDAFDPKTFIPPEAQSVEAAEVDIVTGHDRIQPGRLAAAVFQSATWMLILLWFFGLALPVSIFHESLHKPLVADVFLEENDPESGIYGSGIHAELATDASGLPELIPTFEDPESLPMFPGRPERIEVTWPSHASFVPRALASTPFGTKLFVSDDFNLYVGDLLVQQKLMPAESEVAEVAEEAETEMNAGLTKAEDEFNSAASAVGSELSSAKKAASNMLPWVSRRSTVSRDGAAGPGDPALDGGVQSSPALRGLRTANEEGTGQMLKPTQVVQNVSSVEFHSGAGCQALQGQALKDIAAVCHTKYTWLCRLLVLTKRGRRLVECPLPEPRLGGSGWETPSASGRLVKSWGISQEWLRSKLSEEVASLAANQLCLRAVDEDGEHGGGVVSDESAIFEPGRSGCLSVGTSSGRIVQMQQSLTDDRRLIPERIMHQRSHPSGRGSLCVAKGRFMLALWAKYSSISAFDVLTGSMVKEWRLPTHVQWLMVSAGGESLFMVGVRSGKHVELYRFELPPELRGEEQEEKKEDGPMYG